LFTATDSFSWHEDEHGSGGGSRGGRGVREGGRWQWSQAWEQVGLWTMLAVVVEENKQCVWACWHDYGYFWKMPNNVERGPRKISIARVVFLR
jgi:hypothetical protein